MGTVPLKFRPPSKKDQDNVMAFAPAGVMTYARGARVCAIAPCWQQSAMPRKIKERTIVIMAGHSGRQAPNNLHLFLVSELSRIALSLEQLPDELCPFQSQPIAWSLSGRSSPYRSCP